MEFKKFLEPFPESQIEWRIGQSGKSGEKIWGTCLAYIQARAIMDRLDEVAGPDRWKAEYAFIGTAGVMCRLAVKCGDEWVTKEDGAEATEIEPFKGGISGALKRAAVLWGIGRYLYDLEAGFIDVVQKGAPGARYAKLKDGGAFYWVPPRLPAWALPPNANAPGDRVLPRALETPAQGSAVDTGDYRVTFGKKYLGKRIKEIPRDEIEAYLDWLFDAAAKKNVPPGHEVELLRNAVDRFYGKPVGADG